MVSSQPFCFRHQVTPFVILFIERDGSTYLTSMLGEHARVRMVYERFAVMRQQDATAAEQIVWARDFLTAPLVGRLAAMGFKTKLVDVLDSDAFASVLHETGSKIVRMQRRNLVKAVVSRVNARRLYEATGKWNLYDKSDRMPPFAIEPAKFQGYIQEREQAEQALDDYVVRLSLPSVTISYEDLLLDKDAVLVELFAFLGVPAHSVKGKPLKHTSDDLQDVVLNFDELRDSVAGTRYAPMFDEVLVPSR